MTDNNNGKNQDSRTQILLALVGLVGTLGVALITNWEKFEKWFTLKKAGDCSEREAIDEPDDRT